jgi:hypothetical protein
MARLLALFLTLTCLDRALAAQVAGMVVDEGRNAVPHALVDLWSPTTRLASQITENDGHFHFPPAVSLDATAIVVRAVGFSPTRVTLGDQRLDLRIELTRFARTLEAITVQAQPMCPNRADAAARSLWQALSRRYLPFKPAVGYRSAMRVAEARVQPADLGATDTNRLLRGALGATSLYYAQETARVVKFGYGIPFSGTVGRYDHWQYPELESLFAGHFIDPLFGERHSFSFDVGASRMVIVFCPRQLAQPAIEGSFELDRDSALAKITWRFRTPAPVEEAGGQVLFVRAQASGASTILLPAIGMAWRRLMSDYYQVWMQFEDWKPCSKDEPGCG